MAAKKRSRLVLKVLFAAVWTVFVAEWFLRLLDPVPVVPRYVMAGPDGIRVNEPNRTYEQRSADFHIQIHTNAEGMRCDEDIPFAKPPGVKRIVVLGDSFSMGYENSLHDSFITQMEMDLKAAGENVQVVNLSVSGYGNAEELICLDKEGLRYDPDLVLLCWNETDYDDNVRSALYKLGTDGKPVRATSTYLPGVAIQQQLNCIPGYDWVQANMDLYSFVRETVSYRIAKPLLLLLGERSVEKAPTLKQGPEADASYPAALTLALLHEIGSVAEAHHARYLIFDIPLHEGNEKFFSVFPHDAAGGTYGLPTVSPVEYFGTHCGQGLIYWTRSQGHFTPFGSAFVGEILAQRIAREHLLDATAR